MENFQKFEGINYVNNFAKKINSVHQLVEKNLQKFLPENSIVLDLGGGPGIGAKIIEKTNKKAKVYNIEPSNNVETIPDLKKVEYKAIKLSFKEALDYEFDQKADVLLMVSAAHEIALSNKKSNKENKTEFFKEIKDFIDKNIKPDGLVFIGFPNYKPEVSSEEVLKQRQFVDSLLGHSHPPEEFFTVKEFSEGLSLKPFVFEQQPMTLAGESDEETKLMANFIGFRLS